MFLFELADGTHIYVEQQGAGEPLLLIPGLGAGTWLWSKIQKKLSKNYHLIMPELRGSGRSDKPDKRYSINMFAQDLKSILEQLNIDRIHLTGVSMGGFVAQKMTAKWPGLVSSLTLVATSYGGDEQTGPEGDILSRMISPRGRTKKERLEDAYKLNFTKVFIEEHAEELEKITNWRAKCPQPAYAYYRQLLAGHSFDGLADAATIAVPTLICAGKDDTLVPLVDVLMLHDKIRQSRLHLFEGKHLFFYEDGEQFSQVLLEFLQEQSTEQWHGPASSYQEKEAVER